MERENNNNNKLSYLLSATAGAAIGAFTMMMFMFNLVAQQAEIQASLKSHLTEWGEFRRDFYDKERDNIKEHKEMRNMIYTIREEISESDK